MTKTLYAYIKNIIKYTIFVLSLLFFISVTNADYDSFVGDLKKVGIDVETIKSSKSISRYTLTKLLNSVNCNDCMNPDSNIINKYNADWWKNFSIGRDF